MDFFLPNPLEPQAIVDAALRDLPDLVIQKADRPATVRALTAVLRQSGVLFERGNALVKLVKPAESVMPRAMRLSHNNVIVETHSFCRPVRVGDDGKTVPITLPDNVARMLLDFGEWGCPPLVGICTAPLLSADGGIRAHRGYDPQTGLFCANVPEALLVPESPTRQQAAASLMALRDVIKTFPFKDAERRQVSGVWVVDSSKPAGGAESALLVLIMTAVCRPSLSLAPGALITAPQLSGAGSGKGLLVRMLSEIAFGSQPSALTAGHDRQELDKRIVSALMEADPVLFLDNINGVSLYSDTLASVMTERSVKVRIMGLSQNVLLNSSAFVVVTGNGLSVGQDLVRRFIEVALDAQCENPESRKFPQGFLGTIRERRGELLGHALTIWRWGRQSANSIGPGITLGSFEEWCSWCRDPLLALGCADPVAGIQSAKATDPARLLVVELFNAWWQHHAGTPMKASELAEAVQRLLDMQGRGRQYIAARLNKMKGTRASGFMLTYQPPAGKTGGTYALAQTEALRDE